MKIVVVHNTYQEPAGKTSPSQQKGICSETAHRIRYSRSNDEIATTSGPRRLLMVKDIIHSEGASEKCSTCCGANDQTWFRYTTRS